MEHPKIDNRASARATMAGRNGRLQLPDFAQAPKRGVPMRNAAIALLLLMISAAARTSAEPLSTTILVTVADLGSPHARAMLNHRMRNAIESVCGSYATIETYQIPEMDSCWRSARAQVSMQLGRLHGDAQVALKAK